MCRDVRTRGREHREVISKLEGLDLLAYVINQLNMATPKDSTMATTPVPPQFPFSLMPLVPEPVRRKYMITRREEKKSLDVLETIPKDLLELQPRPSQTWNCD